MSRLAACTIVSKNYLPFARVLARSFLERVPGGRFFVLLVDRIDGHFDPAQEPFEVMEVESLENLGELSSFLFQYTVLEANTAVKPFFLEALFERHQLENLVYFDPDIWITGDLEPLAQLLDEYQVVLTPHLTHAVEDDAYPGELAILQSGTYNLGFVGLRGGKTSRQLLRWWQERLRDQCVVRIEDGLFVDQKWMDLTPGLYPGVHVLRDPGYNVAYWNLHGREVLLRQDADGGQQVRVRSAGEGLERPLVFFHFSGIQPQALDQVSKHQDRWTLNRLGDGAELYRQYAQRLLDAGYLECKPWPYAFAHFHSGVKIPALARRLYLDLGPGRERFGDPFADEGSSSFMAWLNEPARAGAPRDRPYLSRLLSHLSSTRPDLSSSFPDPAGASLPEFSAWVQEYGRHELRLDPAFLRHLHQDSRATLLTTDGLKRRARNRLKRAYHSSAGRQARGSLRRVLGPERFRRLKSKVRPEGDPAPGPVRQRRWRLGPPSPIEQPGINLVGYLQAETGMGEAARGLARAAETAGIPLSLHSLELNVLARQGDRSFPVATSDFPYGINLLVVNADQVAELRQHLGAQVFGGRYNVGYWLWEQAEFPEHWLSAFDPLHEVWTPSTFCLDAISALAPVPVRRVPIPVVAGEADGERESFQLAPSTFVVLFLFNYLSYVERKNPLALIEAFKAAFGQEDDALLLLKTSHADFAPEQHQRLVEAAEGAKVRFLDEYLDRDQVAQLMAASDVYASLHRGEGFGLTLAEAMALGKPVVATGYSGVSDFFDLNVGLPVRYRMAQLQEAAGPYRAGSSWAEPEVGHAAEQLRRLYDDRSLARQLGEAGQQRVQTELSYQAVGATLRQRYEQLVARSHRGALP